MSAIGRWLRAQFTDEAMMKRAMPKCPGCGRKAGWDEVGKRRVVKGNINDRGFSVGKNLVVVRCACRNCGTRADLMPSDGWRLR